jgi:hypothetical protein
METGFCTLEAAFRFGQPEIWNSDQGSQFTSPDFKAPLKKRDIARSRRETPAGGRTAAAGCGGGDWLSFADRIVSVTQPILLWCFDPHQ